jgi:hypothetical protein
MSKSTKKSKKCETLRLVEDKDIERILCEMGTEGRIDQKAKQRLKNCIN